MKKNYVRLEGNVGFDPRVTTLDNGQTVMRLSMATAENYRNKAGEAVTETIWHSISAWKSKYIPDFSGIKKGTHLVVIGRIKPVQYTTNAGVEKLTYEIVASELQFTSQNTEEIAEPVEVLKEEAPKASRKRKKS